MEDERLQVTYEPTPDDWRAYYRFMQPDVASGDNWDRPGAARMHVWVTALFASLIGVFASLPAVDLTRVLLAGLLGTLFGLFYGRFIWPKRAPDEEAFVDGCKQDPYARSQRSLTLTRDAIEEATTFGRVSLSWTFIRRVELGHEHLFMSIDENSTYCVPIRAFDTADEANAFCEAALRFFAASRDPGRALGFPVIQSGADGTGARY